MRLVSPPLLSESTHRVRGHRTGSDFFGFSWEFPTLERRTPLRNSSAQLQLEPLSPHGLGNLLDQ